MRLKCDRKVLAFQLTLLVSWLFLGAWLRLANLELKPPWSDEWASLVFSLGNSFQTVKLNQLISLGDLLAPLQVDLAKTTADTVNNLLTESTHPPLYFVLNHWWLQLTNSDGALVSIWWGRCFSAIWGTVSIAGMFALGLVVFRSWIVAQLAASLMALSPFGVYLAQETRHYTLAIVWLIGSLTCLLLAVNKLNAPQERENTTKIAWSLVITWLVVNILGVATHYFFTLALVAQTLVLAGYWGINAIKKPHNWLSKDWQKVYIAIAATVVGCLPWLWLWRSIPDNQLTSWVYQDNSWFKFYEPIGRILLWLITDIALLPVEGVPDAVAICSGVILIGTLAWLTPYFWRGYQQVKPVILVWFLVAAIALVLVIALTIGADLSLSARFQFFYFPAWLLLLAAIGSHLWLNSNKFPVAVLVVLGLCGALTINHNFAFQKVERPDLVVPQIVAAYQNKPVAIAIDHLTHGQTGELMSLGWQFQKLIQQDAITWQPQFFLLHNDNRATVIKHLKQQVKQLKTEFGESFQLWLINFSPTPNLSAENCLVEPDYQGRETGYKYTLYSCSV